MNEKSCVSAACCIFRRGESPTAASEILGSSQILDNLALHGVYKGPPRSLGRPPDPALARQGIASPLRAFPSIVPSTNPVPAALTAQESYHVVANPELGLL